MYYDEPISIPRTCGYSLTNLDYVRFTATLQTIVLPCLMINTCRDLFLPTAMSSTYSGLLPNCILHSGGRLHTYSLGIGGPDSTCTYDRYDAFTSNKRRSPTTGPFFSTGASIRSATSPTLRLRFDLARSSVLGMLKGSHFCSLSLVPGHASWKKCPSARCKFVLGVPDWAWAVQSSSPLTTNTSSSSK